MCRECGLVRSTFYEKPYNVTGIIKLTGLQKEPKSINEKIILLERDKPRIQERLLCEDGIVKENTKSI